MLTVLELNGIAVEVSDEAIISLGLSIAQGKANPNEIAEWIIKNTK